MMGIAAGSNIIPFPAPRRMKPALPSPHWRWRVENIILTTLAIAFTALVWGIHLRALLQLL